MLELVAVRMGTINSHQRPLRLVRRPLRLLNRLLRLHGTPWCFLLRR